MVRLRFRFQVSSLLEQSKEWLTSLPIDLLEAVVALVDTGLKKTIRSAVGDRDLSNTGRLLLDSLLSKQEEQNASAVDPGSLDQLVTDALEGAPMEPSTVDKFVKDVGRSLTSSTEKCEACIRDLSKALGLRGPVLVARLIGAMCKSHLPLLSDEVIWMPPSDVLSGGWPNQKELSSTSQQEALEWNIDVLLRSMAAVEPNVEWKDVVREFDHQGFGVCDRAGLRFLWQLLIKAFDGVQRIPMDLVYSKWQNPDSQLQLLKQILMCPDIVKLTDCSPCTKPEPAQDKNGSQGTAGPDEEAANPLVANWKVLEIHEALLGIGERPDLTKLVVELYKQAAAKEGCHDSVTLALLQLRSPIVPLRRTLLLQLIPHYLGVSAHNAQAVLHYAWNGIPQPLQLELQLIVKDAMVDYYTTGDGETQRLTRILELAQEIKCLQTLLAVPRSPDVASHPSE